MKFKNQYPKKEVTIEKVKKQGCLMQDYKAVIHFRHYKAYLDEVQHIVLEGSLDAWYLVKSDFMYDQLMNKVQDFYTDSFGRVLRVKNK